MVERGSITGNTRADYANLGYVNAVGVAVLFLALSAAFFASGRYLARPKDPDRAAEPERRWWRWWERRQYAIAALWAGAAVWVLVRALV